MLYDELDTNDSNNYGYFIDIDDDDTEYDYYKDRNHDFFYDLEESIFTYKEESKNIDHDKAKFFLQTAGFISASVLFIKLWILGNKN
uniref:Uncharacterized protein n=1 Tax=viral metagenome TaxID=1070528 RepID=A0A6C0JG78_9ZZZZ